MNQKIKMKLAPSILAADFSILGEEVRGVERAGVHQIHVDVMDGHFVPNISMGPLIVEAIRPKVQIPLDVHLMISRPQDYFEAFIKAGSDHVTFHVESDCDIDECISTLRQANIGVGLAISPDTPVSGVLEWLPKVDMILVMTVYPGFGGQELIPSTLEKIPEIRKCEKKIQQESDERFRIQVQVDGGIDLSTIHLAAEAGADCFVAGSAIFKADNPADEIRTFLNKNERFSLNEYSRKIQ